MALGSRRTIRHCPLAPQRLSDPGLPLPCSRWRDRYRGAPRRHDRFRRSEGTANSRRGQDRDRLRQTPAYLPRGENLARYEPLGGAVDVARRRRLHRALALAASRDRGIRTESGISAYLGKRGEAFSFRHSARSRPAKLSMKAFRICVLVHLQASISLNEASLQGSSGGGPNSTFHASSKDFFTQWANNKDASSRQAVDDFSVSLSPNEFIA